MLKKLILILLSVTIIHSTHAQWYQSKDPNGRPTPMNLDSNGNLKTIDSGSVPGGVQLSSGTTTATTQRIAVATDDLTATNSTSIKNSVAAIPSKGAATTANSMPVNIASDQTVPVSVSGVSTAANQTTSNGYLATIATTGSLGATAANQATTNASLSTIATTLSTGTNAVVSYNSEVRLTGSFTRPANVTPYVSGYLVANSTTSGSCVPVTFANAVRQAGDCVRIERCSVTLSGVGSAAINQTFKVHIFQASPTVTVGDGASFDSAGVLACNAGLSHAGSFAVTMMFAGSDGAVGRGTPDVGSAVTLSPSSGTSLYALIEATSAYTPVSGQVVAVTLEGYRP
jgi:hypothetical protein